jgi:hypothetical protein
MSLLLLNSGYEQLAKAAGCVSLYDARKDWAIANGVTPDRSGKGNDITWANYAGTAASGLVIENGKVFRRLDGADDFGSMVNSPSLDITNAPLAEFATLRIPAGAGTAYIFSKYDLGWETAQYALSYDATNKRLSTVIENVSRAKSSTNSVLENIWYDVGFIWDGASVKTYVNIIANGTPVALTGILTSRPNVRIGMIGGSSSRLKCDLVNHVVYAGENAVELKILRSRDALSKGYI